MSEKIADLEKTVDRLQSVNKILEFRLAAASHQLAAWELLKRAGEVQLMMEAKAKLEGGEQ